jgi:hypothetical protein
MVQVRHCTNSLSRASMVSINWFRTYLVDSPSGDATRMYVLEYPTLTVGCVGLRQGGGHRNASGGTWPTLVEESGVAGAQRVQQGVHGLLESVGCIAPDNRSFMSLA